MPLRQLRGGEEAGLTRSIPPNRLRQSEVSNLNPRRNTQPHQGSPSPGAADEDAFATEPTPNICLERYLKLRRRLILRHQPRRLHGRREEWLQRRPGNSTFERNERLQRRGGVRVPENLLLQDWRVLAMCVGIPGWNRKRAPNHCG